MSPRIRGIFCILVLACLSGWAVSRGSGGVARAGRKVLCWGNPGRSQPGDFFRPRCISVGPDNTVWILDLTGRIQHFAVNGDYLGSIRMPDIGRGNAQGIDVDHAGFIYVADTHYHRILKFTPSGKLVLEFGKMGTEPGEFFWPCAVTVAEDGTIYTAQYGGIGKHDEVVERIQKWDAHGRLLDHWGSFGEGPGQFMRPAGLDLGPDGNVYVADSGNHRIQVFSPGGRLLRTWGIEGTDPGKLQYPYDVAVDSSGRALVVEYGGSRIQCFAPTGKHLWSWGHTAHNDQGLLQPWSLDVNDKGMVFIADTLNHRVVRINYAEMIKP